MRVPSGLLRGRELPSDFDKQTKHEEIREEAALALRACEKAGISRYEIVEEMDMLDRWSARFQRCCRISSVTARTL